MNKISVFITSSNGYLGSSIISYLDKKKNIRVIRGSRSASKSKEININNWKKDINKIFEYNIDVIIYCTGVNKINANNKNLVNSIHKFDLESMLKESINKNIKKFIYFSSIHVFKPSTKKYYSNDKPNNNSPYAIAHKLSEKILNKYQKKYKNLSIVRLSNCFGATMQMNRFTEKLFAHKLTYSIVNNKKFKLLSSKDQKIDLCPISVFNQLIYSLICLKRLQKFYNLGINSNLNLNYIIDLVVKRTNNISNFKIINVKFDSNKKKQQPLRVNYNLNAIKNIQYLQNEFDKLIEYYKNK